jgi:hypothetical protein
MVYGGCMHIDIDCQLYVDSSSIPNTTAHTLVRENLHILLFQLVPKNQRFRAKAAFSPKARKMGAASLRSRGAAKATELRLQYIVLICNQILDRSKQV